MKLEVRAEWRVADDAVEGGVQKYQYQSHYGEFAGSSASHLLPCRRADGPSFCFSFFPNPKRQAARVLLQPQDGEQQAADDVDEREEDRGGGDRRAGGEAPRH